MMIKYFWAYFDLTCLYVIFLSEHQNYFGVDDNLGPVAVSVRRERLDDGKEKDGMQYNYRVAFRTSQVTKHTCSLLPSSCCFLCHQLSRFILI